MSAHKHTPGPWNVGATDAETAEIDVVSEGRPYICLVLPGAVDGRTEANARLIAAAPELLMALRLASPALEYLRKQFPRSEHDDSIDALAITKSAIAKATGEQQ